MGAKNKVYRASDGQIYISLEETWDAWDLDGPVSAAIERFEQVMAVFGDDVTVDFYENYGDPKITFNLTRFATDAESAELLATELRGKEAAKKAAATKAANTRKKAIAKKEKEIALLKELQERYPDV